MNSLTTKQINAIIFILYTLGASLIFTFIRIDYFSHYSDTFRLVVFSGQFSDYRDLWTEYGIFARAGITGAVLGVVAPVSLFCLAFYIKASQKYQLRGMA